MFTKNDYEKALELHEKSIVIDTLTHGPSPWSVSSKIVDEINRLIKLGLSGWGIRLGAYGFKNKLLLSDSEFRDKYVAYWKKAGVTVLSDTVASGGTNPSTYESSLRGVADMIALCDKLEDVFIKVTKAEHMKQAKQKDKLGIIMNFQNTTQIKGNLENLELFYNLGLRIIQLTYNRRNLIGNGCTERTDDGLSIFGLQAVEKINELGMMIDLSHCGQKTTMDAIEHSKQPCAFTHTFPKALFEHDRGKTDEEIQALAEKGGFIGVTAVPMFFPNKIIDDFAKNVEYIDNLIGIDHIGIGTDWGGPFFPPKAFAERLMADVARMGWMPEHNLDYALEFDVYEHWDDWPVLTATLVAHGYSDGEIRKMLGENFLTLFRRVVG